MAKVLVMEDERGIAMVLQIALSEEGHKVVVVRDGRDGMKIMEQGPIPDIVLVDLAMPGMGGCKVVETMQSAPALKGIPVVILTGSDADWTKLPPENSYKCLIGKPFDLNEVIETVNTLTDYAKKSA